MLYFITKDIFGFETIFDALAAGTRGVGLNRDTTIDDPDIPEIEPRLALRWTEDDPLTPNRIAPFLGRPDETSGLFQSIVSDENISSVREFTDYGYSVYLLSPGGDLIDNVPEPLYFVFAGTAPETLVGQRIAYSEETVADDLPAGVSGVMLPETEFFSALERGVVDGIAFSGRSDAVSFSETDAGFQAYALAPNRELTPITAAGPIEPSPPEPLPSDDLELLVLESSGITSVADLAGETVHSNEYRYTYDDAVALMQELGLSEANLASGSGLVTVLTSGSAVALIAARSTAEQIELRAEESDPNIEVARLLHGYDRTGGSGPDVLRGFVNDDTLRGGDGADTLIGGEGDDFIFGGATEADLRDVIYAGAGNDSVDGGHGNDDLWGGGGADTMAGGFGVDTLRGQDGDDVLTGGAFSDLIFGGDGDDFINGGFGSDRVNGGAGADRFFHVGVAGHGSDWIQDFSHAEGDTLVWGGGVASRSQFQVNIASTAGAGDAGTDEAFVIYRPTGQILWALVDGAGEGSIELQIGGATFDLLA